MSKLKSYEKENDQFVNGRVPFSYYADFKNHSMRIKAVL